MPFDLTDKLVWVAGQHGMVGGAVMRRLKREPCALLLDPGRAVVDLRRQSEVEDWMASRRPRIVFLTAGRVGGCTPTMLFRPIFSMTICSLKQTSSMLPTARVSKNFCFSARRAFIRATLPSRSPKRRC